ncbi:hypothetical protein GCM10025734_10490 [Kitasatospora paranensis]
MIAGTATSVSNRVSRRQAGRWAEQDAAQQAQVQAQAPPPPPPAPAGSSMDDKLAQLKDLGALKEQGCSPTPSSRPRRRASSPGSTRHPNAPPPPGGGAFGRPGHAGRP